MINPLTIRVTGTLSAHRMGLWNALLELGYSPLSSANLLRLVAHLSRWLEQQELTVEELTQEQIEAFFVARRQAGYVQFRTPRALAPILRYLTTAGVIALLPSAPPAQTALNRLVDHYTEYLSRERGLIPTSVRAYGDIARRFLRTRLGEHFNSPLQLDAAAATSFVLAQSERYSTGATKYIVTALRSLFRYLHLHGHMEVNLAGALPAVAGRRLSGLPKFLSADQVRRLLGSCDRRRAVGRRDYAVLLLMVRLGLRQGEVAALALDDIHWQQGEMLIRGKGLRDERLPLPADVGEAMVSYLRRGRPQTSVRRFFVRVRAPHGPLHAGAIGRIVRGALNRAQLPPGGAHRLRHTAATQMLRAGASLDEVAQVLRHRSHDTTAIYAKVDHHALHAVIRQWPGGTS